MQQKTWTVGLVGRAVRIILGVLLLVVAVPYFLFPGVRFEFLGNLYFSDLISIAVALSAIGGFVLFYIIAARILSKYWSNINRWLGAVLANIPPLAVFVFTPGPGKIAAFTYVGFAMILAGLRKDPGCEVMSVPNALLKNQTNLACIIFSPIDWAERKSGSSGKPEAAET